MPTDTLLGIFISRVLETTVPQTSPVQRTKKMLVDLEGGSKMLGNQMIYSSAWGSPSRGSVEFLVQSWCMIYLQGSSFLYTCAWLWLEVSPWCTLQHPWCLWVSPAGCAAKAGFALAPIPPAPLPPLAAAELPQPCGHPNCKSAEIALIHSVRQRGRLAELVHAALPRQCPYNRNEQLGRLLLPGKCVF